MKKLLLNGSVDGRFGVRCSVTAKNHSVEVAPVLIKGVPVLKISKLKVPLCKHHFVFKCPKYIVNQNWNYCTKMRKKQRTKLLQEDCQNLCKTQSGNLSVCHKTKSEQKNQIMNEESKRKKERQKLFDKMFSKLQLFLKKYSCEAVFVMLLIGTAFFIKWSEKDWKSIVKYNSGELYAQMYEEKYAQMYAQMAE